MVEKYSPFKELSLKSILLRPLGHDAFCEIKKETGSTVKAAVAALEETLMPATYNAYKKDRLIDKGSRRSCLTLDLIENVSTSFIALAGLPEVAFPLRYTYALYAKKMESELKVTDDKLSDTLLLLGEKYKKEEPDKITKEFLNEIQGNLVKPDKFTIFSKK